MILVLDRAVTGFETFHWIIRSRGKATSKTLPAVLRLAVIPEHRAPALRAWLHRSLLLCGLVAVAGFLYLCSDSFIGHAVLISQRPK